jgi:hypothetical protein
VTTLQLSDHEAYVLELALDDVAEVYRSDDDIQGPGYAPIIRRVQERLQQAMMPARGPQSEDLHPYPACQCPECRPE